MKKSTLYKILAAGAAVCAAGLVIRRIMENNCYDEFDDDFDDDYYDELSQIEDDQNTFDRWDDEYIFGESAGDEDHKSSCQDVNDSRDKNICDTYRMPDYDPDSNINDTLYAPPEIS